VEHWKSYLTKKYSMTFILRKLYFMVGDENKSKLNILIKKHFLNTNLTPSFNTYHYLWKKNIII